MTTYSLVKLQISRGKTEGMADILDVFLLAGRITTEQYTELMGMLVPVNA